VGFEPTIPEGIAVFETAPFNHSGTSPHPEVRAVALLYNRNSLVFQKEHSMTGFSAKFKLPCFKINSFIASSFLIF
jgi:hypothetical protein